jgi:hypothetical protein
MPMAAFMDSDAIIALGKQLVEELELGNSVDTLGRWMAHYIAELITKVEAARPEERDELSSRCAAAILDLWRHRSVLPTGKRPFEEIEPILRAVQSLDPEDATPRYFRSARPHTERTAEEAEAQKWLDLADQFDNTARILIRHCLAQAASAALDKAREWVRLAETAGADEGIERLVVQILAVEGDAGEAATNREREMLENRVERLELFVAEARKLAASWRDQLQVTASDLAEGGDRNGSVVTEGPCS